MEIDSPTNYLALFKFSNISWILSYCSYLDQWRRIMTMLCKFSNMQWMKHEEAFIWYGKEFRRNVYIEDNVASDIQIMVSARQLFNQMLLKRKYLKLYLEKNLLMNKARSRIGYALIWRWYELLSS